jgi:hypothetical protein
MDSAPWSKYAVSYLFIAPKDVAIVDGSRDNQYTEWTEI